MHRPSRRGVPPCPSRELRPASAGQRPAPAAAPWDAPAGPARRRPIARPDRSRPMPPVWRLAAATGQPVDQARSPDGTPGAGVPTWPVPSSPGSSSVARPAGGLPPSRPPNRPNGSASYRRSFSKTLVRYDLNERQVTPGVSNAVLAQYRTFADAWEAEVPGTRGRYDNCLRNRAMLRATISTQQIERPTSGAVRSTRPAPRSTIPRRISRK